MRQSGVPLLVLDVGDAFGQSSQVSALDDMLKAETLLQGMALCGYDALGLGDREFRFGEAFLGEHLDAAALQALAANVVRTADGKLYAASFLTRHLGPLKVGVIAVLDPDYDAEVREATRIAGDELTITPVKPAIDAARELMGEVDVGVLLAHMSRDKARELALSLTGFKLVVAAEDGAPGPPETAGSALLVDGGYDGKWVVHLDLTFDATGMLTKATWRDSPLDATWPDEPQLAALYQQYLERLKDEADKIVDSIPQQDPPGGDYLGAKVCKDCHPEAVIKWAGTAHAQAFATLEQTNHDWDPSCFACHTTGFGYKSGYLLPDRTPQLGGVQCEACHGSAGDHVANSTTDWSPDPTSSCVRCHTPEHSPDFNIGTYLPQIEH